MSRPVLFAITSAALAGAWLVKLPCVREGSTTPTPSICYTDIVSIYEVKKVSSGLAYRDYLLEYPVGTGSFIEISAEATQALARFGIGSVGAESFFDVSVLLLAPLGLLVAGALWAAGHRDRILMWAAGPPLLLYAFQNWDLLVVALATIALVDLQRGRSLRAGAALGLGASAKFFPILFLPVALVAMRARGSKPIRPLLIGFGAAAVLLNVPWMLIAPDGWIATWRFQAAQDPAYHTFWYWLGRHAGELAPQLLEGPGLRRTAAIGGAVLFAVGATLILIRTARVGRTYPARVAAGSLAMLALFMVTSKTYSAQYALWLVPLFVLAELPWLVFAAFVGTDLVVYAAAFGWGSLADGAVPPWLLEAGVLGRAVVLVGIVLYALRQQRQPNAAPQGLHPRSA